MRAWLKVILLLLVSSGCSLLPPTGEYRSELVDQQDNGQVCLSARPYLYTKGGDNEVMTIGFGDSLKFLEVRPEGDTVAKDPVRWSLLNYDKTERYVVLTRPEVLEPGKISAYVDETVCVEFRKNLFADEEYELDNFNNLSGVICCGELVRSKK
jgi:hypothetical protein